MAKHLRHIHFFKHLLKRFLKRVIALRKRTKLLTIALLINAGLLAQLYANIWVYPNTYLGGEAFSGKTRTEVYDRLESFLNLPYQVVVQNRRYTYTYKNLGVRIDENEATSRVFAPNRLPFVVNIAALVHSLVVRRNVEIPLVFTQEFNQFIQQSVFDFGDGGDDILFDPTAKTLTYVENEEKYRFDESYLQKLLRDRLGNNALPLYPKLTKVKNERADTIATTAERIKNVYLNPLTVYVDAGGNRKTFILAESELARIVNIQLSSDQTNVTIGMHDDVLTKTVNDHVHKLGFLTRDNVATPKVKDDIQAVLSARFAGHTIDGVTLSLDSGPNTTGTNAAKYIEVDISQQKMYLFKNTKLVKTYRISTGLEYPTPTGEFKILNKVGVGYSNIYNVWMPYWMGFSYSSELHAYFGIHELPYTLTGNQKVQRPRELIGSPNTGGCIALDVGAAREVYVFADVGTPVLIFN